MKRIDNENYYLNFENQYKNKKEKNSSYIKLDKNRKLWH